jgi:hypothetical protein
MSEKSFEYRVPSTEYRVVVPFLGFIRHSRHREFFFEFKVNELGAPIFHEE